MTAGFIGCCRDAGLPAGAMEKLADIISPAPEDAPTADAIWEKLQRGLKGAQAVLEKGQASAFGEQARTHSSLCACALASGTLPLKPPLARVDALQQLHSITHCLCVLRCFSERSMNRMFVQTLNPTLGLKPQPFKPFQHAGYERGRADDCQPPHSHRCVPLPWPCGATIPHRASAQLPVSAPELYSLSTTQHAHEQTCICNASMMVCCTCALVLHQV